MSTFDTPANIEEIAISTNLNSSMLQNFLIGLYTIVYAGTVYLYQSKKPANISRRGVLITISALYLLCFLDFVLEWYFLNWSIVINGSTRDSVFNASQGGPAWLLIIDDLIFNTVFVISDGLLIWRCYHAWGQSFRVIALPLILFVAEIALSVTDTVLEGIFGNISSVANVTLSSNIATALAFISLGTTIATTFLIGYRIHSASRQGRSPSKRSYDYIIVTIIESSAAYLLVLIFYAILVVVPSFRLVDNPMDEATPYVDVLLPIVAGMAPTVMVARLALTNLNNTAASATMTHISGLDFSSQPGNRAVRSAGGTREDIDTPTETSNEKLAPGGFMDSNKRISRGDSHV